MRRALGATTAVIAGSLCALVLGSAPAVADGTIVVRGTSFPHASQAQLSFVGCSGIFAATPEDVQPYVGLGPGTAPAGLRSLKYDLAGGNAMGSLHYVSSMQQTTTAALSVRAAAGARGVAYAGYQEAADDGTFLVWFGRAALSGAGTGWQKIDATTLSYQWTKYDMSSQEVLDAGPATTMSVADFTAMRGGDGPGLYTIGFGCDGQPFHMDALQIDSGAGLTTYDLEGLDTSTAIGGDAHTITAGEEVLLTGAVRHSGSQRLADSTLLLEQRAHGATGWSTVEVLDAGATDPTVAVSPLVRTTYRWRFVDRPLAEASTSREFRIDVAPRVSADVVRSDGSPVAVAGTTVPARPGAEAVLWRMTAKGPMRVGRTTSDAKGRYRIALRDGSAGRFLVTVAGGRGSLGGKSAEFAVEDSAPGDDVTPSAAPSPSASPTAKPSPSMPTLPPSATPSGQPTPKPTPSEPDPGPSELASPSPSAKPTPSTTPSSSAKPTPSTTPSSSGSPTASTSGSAAPGPSKSKRPSPSAGLH